MEDLRSVLGRSMSAAARAHIDAGDARGRGIAIYTLADPRDASSARYVGQTRAPLRRYAQHVRTARLSLPDDVPWWVTSPQYRPLYVWIRELHRDGGRLPFMRVVEWLEQGTNARVAERAAIMALLAQGAALLNVEARSAGAQLALL